MTRSQTRYEKSVPTGRLVLPGTRLWRGMSTPCPGVRYDTHKTVKFNCRGSTLSLSVTGSPREREILLTLRERLKVYFPGVGVPWAGSTLSVCQNDIGWPSKEIADDMTNCIGAEPS